MTPTFNDLLALDWQPSQHPGFSQNEWLMARLPGWELYVRHPRWAKSLDDMQTPFELHYGHLMDGETTATMFQESRQRLGLPSQAGYEWSVFWQSGNYMHNGVYHSETDPNHIGEAVDWDSGFQHMVHIDRNEEMVFQDVVDHPLTGLARIFKFLEEQK